MSSRIQAVFKHHAVLFGLLSLLLPICTAVAAGAYDCRVYEYAELKETNTQELLSRGAMYHHTTEFLQKSVGLTERYGYHQLGPKVAEDEKDALKRCRGEAQRIASLLRKRKDSARAIKNYGYEPPFYDQFADKFGLPTYK